jgi:hypothetical protein
MDHPKLQEGMGANALTLCGFETLENSRRPETGSFSFLVPAC